MSIDHRRQSKAVTIAYASLAFVILLVVAALALVVVPPSPPSVSEFAPQAVEQIDQAPQQQSSRFGSGAGGACTPGQNCEDPDAAGALASPRKAIERARVRRCVGDPPRQTEDPQSPPCVNYFEGDNGGATSKGVTRNEIRVAIGRPFQLTENQIMQLVEFFNRRYEFYGRTIRPFLLDSYSSAQGKDPVIQRVAAAKADEEFRAFAGVGGVYNATSVDSRPYFDEIARRRLIGIDPEPTYQLGTQLAGSRPYLWSYAPPIENAERNQAEWVCKSLVGRVAEHAGSRSPQLRLQTRKFAVVSPEIPAGSPPVDELVAGLKRCNAPLEMYRVQDSQGSARNQPVVNQMQADGVTSIMCVCAALIFSNDLMSQAGSAQYYPEWVVSGVAGQGSDDTTVSNTDQQGQMFGMAAYNKILSTENDPPFWALKEIDFQAPPPTNKLVRADLRALYHGLLVLASGVQAAGPMLNPFTFERGLQRISFSNPGAGQAPYWQARVGFEPGDYSMINDFTLQWYTFRNLESGGNPRDTGSWCYIGRGARYASGGWPEGRQPFFDETQPCR